MGCGQTKIGIDATGGVAPGTPVIASPVGSAPETPSKVRIERPNSKTIHVESTDSPIRRKRGRPLIKRNTLTGSHDNLTGGHGGQGDALSQRGNSATSKTSYHSSDSGFMDNSENHPNFVSEDSDPSKVQQVEDNFREPLTMETAGFDVVGKAVPQRLSAKDQTRLEEQRVLASLQAEGLIARPVTHAKNSMYFEVVSQEANVGGGMSLPPLRRPPARLAKLERRTKKKKNLTEEDIKAKLEKAERRKKELELRRMEKLQDLTHKNTSQTPAMDNFESFQREKEMDTIKAKKDIVAENREKYLRDMREKLKAKQEHAERVRERRRLASVDLADDDQEFQQPSARRRLFSEDTPVGVSIDLRDS